MFWATWFPMLLMSVWDLCVLGEGFMNIDAGAELEYLVGFMANNWRILLLRFALWRLKSDDTKYVQLIGSIGWFVIYFTVGDANTDCTATDTVFNSFEAQMAYYGLGVLSGLLGIFLAPTGYIAVYLEQNTIWTRCEDKWQGFAWRGKKGAEPQGDPAFQLKVSRVDALCRFLKNATPKPWNPLASMVDVMGAMKMKTMRF